MINKRIAAGILLAGAISLTGTHSFAEGEAHPSEPRINTEKTIQSPARREQIQAGIKNAIDGLVKDGTITKEQKDAVLKAMEQRWKSIEKEKERFTKGRLSKDDKCKPRGRQFRHSVLEDLVKNGTITKEQADAIREAIRSVHESMKKHD
jgi:polyhydroxyalkanoate synthesis regulator phasin